MCFFVNHACLEHQVGGDGDPKVIRVHGKDTNNNTGYGVSLDQIQSSQPGLVSKFIVKITSACIWATKLMLEHFSYTTNVHHRSITRQKDTFTGT